MLRARPYIPLRRLLCRCSSSSASPELTSYKVAFSRKMASAGINPRHKIALGVSGGPDSMALCVLTAWWKLEGLVKKNESGFIEGLLGIIVDHGLRTESSDEAKLVQNRVNKLGVKCEIASCDWPAGRPKLGHLQESAREVRYQKFMDVCVKRQIGILLVAHHSDDQAELLVLRLSRNSGVLGLAGMAFISQLFPKYLNPEINNGLLLVRPMLDFSKDDMYKICEGANQAYVEDPTNKNLLFVRNRIRSSLSNLSPCFLSEIQNLILACRLTRNYVDKVCQELINESLTISQYGYAIIDLGKLKLSDLDDLFLSHYLSYILQFISQRHRPVRGRSSKLLIDYIRNFPCKSSLTLSGCCISPAPGFKGRKIIISFCTDSPISSKNGLIFYKINFPLEESKLNTEVNEIIRENNSCSDLLIGEKSNIPFINTKSPNDILTEAKRLNLISESTLNKLNSLQTEEQNKFSASNEIKSEEILKEKCLSDYSCSFISPGQTVYFMNRFLITYNKVNHNPSNYGAHWCELCQAGKEREEEFHIRHMADSDWLFLSEVSRSEVLNKGENVKFNEYKVFSAKNALRNLKLIPACARRTLPVIVNHQGLLVNIPSIGFSFCPLLKMEAVFRPRVPIGGGYTSYK
ncbi:hypothetical protein LUZ60_012573 [Juncus effusus]|nr:hypothetical protein LUZ60_012573 [Juncus effusus]